MTPIVSAINTDYSGDALIKVRLIMVSGFWLRSAYSKNNANKINYDGDLNNNNANKTVLGLCPDLPLKNKQGLLKNNQKWSISSELIECVRQRNLTLF